MIKESEVLRLVERNPYTGSPVVDMAGVFLLLARVWAEGYECGVADGCDDVLVVDQSTNPYYPVGGGGGSKAS